MENAGLIAYFDYLGYADFILNNELDYQARIIQNNHVSIERALSGGKLIHTEEGFINNLDEIDINSIVFSDTVILTTKSISRESVQKFLKTCFDFNHFSICHNFPVRGCIGYGEYIDYFYHEKNQNGGAYTASSLFGRGLVEVYGKAENQNWAGSFIDESLVKLLDKMGIDPSKDLAKIVMQFPVPRKNAAASDEWVLKLAFGNEPVPQEYIINTEKGIRDNFQAHNKSIQHEGVREKIENTIEFLKAHAKLL